MGYLQIHGIPQSFYDDMEIVYVNSDEVYENNDEVWNDDDVELDGHEVKQEQLHMDHGHVVHTQGQQLPLTHEEGVVEQLELVSKVEQCHHSHNHKCNQHSHTHSHSHQQHR